MVAWLAVELFCLFLIATDTRCDEAWGPLCLITPSRFYRLNMGAINGSGNYYILVSAAPWASMRTNESWEIARSCLRACGAFLIWCRYIFMERMGGVLPTIDLSRSKSHIVSRLVLDWILIYL